MKLPKLARGLKNPRANDTIKKLIGAIYRSFAMQRFSRLSRGGGEWAPLSPRTIAGRRKKSKSILINTGLLFGVLAPSPSPGWLEETRESGFRFGYGGPSRYGSGSVTLADIASFHQEGGPRLPQRKIIVEPDTQTLRIMTERITQWLAKQIQ